MIGDHTPVPTLAVKDLGRAREFYEGVLGLTPGRDMPGGVAYNAGSSGLFVYESEYAGTNKATAMMMEVPADAFDTQISDLRSKGVSLRDLRHARHAVGRRRRDDEHGRRLVPQRLVPGPRRQHPQPRHRHGLTRPTGTPAPEPTVTTVPAERGVPAAQVGGRHTGNGCGTGPLASQRLIM